MGRAKRVIGCEIAAREVARDKGEHRAVCRTEDAGSRARRIGSVGPQLLCSSAQVYLGEPQVPNTSVGCITANSRPLEVTRSQAGISSTAGWRWTGSRVTVCA